MILTILNNKNSRIRLHTSATICIDESKQQAVLISTNIVILAVNDSDGFAILCKKDGCALKEFDPTETVNPVYYQLQEWKEELPELEAAATKTEVLGEPLEKKLEQKKMHFNKNKNRKHLKHLKEPHHKLFVCLLLTAQKTYMIF